ncbi:MAG: class I SAM-dependent methyltransferase [Chitinophagia bacterium]|nr:class I SAM-dependent methyltransferase [Chitinophagia bacterium]
MLLEMGWKTGRAIDLQPKVVERLKCRFQRQILERRYKATKADFFSLKGNPRDKYDLIISCMVLEHLNDRREKQFMRLASKLLRKGGSMIGLVPASSRHWGIEDEVAGHYRRYTRDKLKSLASVTNWKIRYLVGLTYPVSNMLLPISNILVSRFEQHKLKLANNEKTKKSGIRNVPFKNKYPSIFRFFLNRYLLLPLHWLQMLCSNSKSALVLYFEAVPN